MQQSQAKTVPSFGPIRSFLWPVHAREHKKVLPMLAIFFLITFVYNLLRCIKQPIVVKAASSGVFAIPFLKVGFVLPGAFLFTYLFTHFVNRFSREKVFYMMLSIFVIFFGLFAFLVYPNKGILEVTTFEPLVQSGYLPEGFLGLIACIRHWALSVFYVFCELWGSVVLSMLFWGFANEVTALSEAKRFYALFALAGNSSSMFSGQVGQLLTVDVVKPWILGHTAWEQTVVLHISFVIVVCCVIVGLFWWMNRQTDIFPPCEKSSRQQRPVKSPSSTITLRECFSYFLKSRYALCIVTIVIAYNLVYNLADVLWSEQVDIAFPAPQDYSRYIHKITFLTGVLATLFSLLISGKVIRRYGWIVAALIPPVIWGATSIGFFSSMLCQQMITHVVMNPVNMALLFSSAQMCLGRASKYTVFDETKEIAFIPLPKEEQRKVKAVVDGLASRVGKSGGSTIYIVLFAFVGTVDKTIPYVAVMMSCMIVFWIYAVISLNKMVNVATTRFEERVQPPVDTEVTLEETGYAKV